MIHFLSVHINNKWADIQTKFIRHYVKDCKIYAITHRINPNPFDEVVILNPDLGGYDVLSTGAPSAANACECTHRGKLVWMANKFLIDKLPEDLMCFLDSDAFPISKKFTKFMEESLLKYDFAAINRNIEFRDTRPQVICFCTKIKNYFKLMPPMDKPIGELGQIWKSEIEKKPDAYNWLKMLRTHRLDECKFRLATYANVVFHFAEGSYEGVLEDYGKELPLDYNHDKMFDNFNFNHGKTLYL
jgi:hypothetical protein